MKSLVCWLALMVIGCGEAPPPEAPPTANPSPLPQGKAQPTTASPPQAPPPPPPQGPGGSGAAMQDPTGFPPFHDWPAPGGPPIAGRGAWSDPVKLTEKPGGGYRPQIAIAPDDRAHALYYERTDDGDLIRHRISNSQGEWSPPAELGHRDERNWGPDIVARPDGSLAVVYDHALKDFRSRGYFTAWSSGRWTEPLALTPDDGGEVGSGHIAHGAAGSLAYVYIGKTLSPTDHFQARYRWFINGEWGPIGTFTDGQIDAWHTNVERRPDGSLLAGWDVGLGGAETTVFVVEGRDGSWTQPENISSSSFPGERVHFAFGDDGIDHLTWFHKVAGRPIHVYTRSGRPGNWGPTQIPSKGFGGFHFDPDIAINQRGVRCLVWGWDGGDQAELVYSIDRGSGWMPPRRVASIGWGKPGLPSIDVDSRGRFHVIWNQGIRGYNEVYTSTLEVR